MSKFDIKLLDCTLRDGGYVNDWKWGYEKARDIISFLVKARVDVVEVGFLRNVDNYIPDLTVCNHIEELNNLLPDETERTIFSAMAMRSNYDINKLSPYRGKGIEMIRITAHDYDIEEGMDFASQVKDKGYKLAINPINIMGYSDSKILWILEQVNKIHPYQFSIVDTFGSMKRRDLDRIVSLVDHNLSKDIRVALHLHENMSLSCCLAQNYIDRHLDRPIAIDASLMGMGRIPGNLPIELIADYLNDYSDNSYDIDYLMDAIQEYISPLKGETQWGYTPAYYLSAKFNLHRNYAEHYLKKGDLTNRDINHILSRFDRKKATAYDSVYADKLYEEYHSNNIDDKKDRELLNKELNNKNILIIAPGQTINNYKNIIDNFINIYKPIIISLNFIPDLFKIDYAFFSNNRRFYKAKKKNSKLILTSNITEGAYDYKIDYNSVSCPFNQGSNSYILLLKLLSSITYKNLYVAGADGYSENGNNYYKPNIKSHSVQGHDFNMAIIEAIKNLGIKVNYITPSKYDLKE